MPVSARLARRSGDTGAPEAPDRGAVAKILRQDVPMGIAMLLEVGVFLGATHGATGMRIGLAAGSATVSAFTLLHLRRILRHQIP